jgi:hypothetical protein
MGLRILILFCSLTSPEAKPSHRDAIPVGTLEPLSCKSSDASSTVGHSQPVAGCCSDRLWSASLLSDCEEDESEDDFHVPAFAIRQVRGINLEIALFTPAYPSPLAAHFSTWCTPLRC